LILDDDVTETMRWFYPDDPKIKWQGVADPGKIKPWWVKAPWVADWNDPGKLLIAHASRWTRAKRKGWLALDELGLVTRADFLPMQVKRAPDVDICSIEQLGVQGSTRAGS
jgi:hypothetical protein